MLDERFDALSRGAALVFVTDADPAALRVGLDPDHIGSYEWQSTPSTPGIWRVTITRRTAELPRLLGNIADVVTAAVAAGRPGAVWKLASRRRQLDANIVHLPPTDSISPHLGADVDVLLVVLDGSGVLTTEAGDVELVHGGLGWLPQRSLRAITAGQGGLTYLTVHRRRRSPGLTIGRRRPAEPDTSADT